MQTTDLRRITAAALVLAPALFLLDNILHPRELARGNEAEQLAEIADAYQRWQAAHAIGFVSVIVFAVAVAGLAALIYRTAPRVGLAGGALAIAGLMGLAAAITIDGYTWGVLGEVSARPDVDAATVERAFKDVQESDWSLVYYLTPLGFTLGMMVLVVGAVRARLAPVWAGALLALGVLMVSTETAIISNVYFVVGAAVLLAGGASVAWSITTQAADLHVAACALRVSSRGTTSITDPSPWWIVSGRPSSAPSLTAAEPVASSSSMPSATGNTRALTIVSSTQAYLAASPRSLAGGPGSASTSAGEPSSSHSYSGCHSGRPATNARSPSTRAGTSPAGGRKAVGECPCRASSQAVPTSG